MMTWRQVLGLCVVFGGSGLLLWVIWKTAPFCRRAFGGSNLGRPSNSGKRSKKARSANPLKRTNERVHAPKVSTSTRYRS